ncbi:hypothetical protein MHM83_09585 [Tenacibaculum sp. Mcav3-52]|uniref:SpoVT-AbrB domain-containing protein n=1 Tax=Tenacibaculum sp. Pbs-1 TaxID=3238748 RepID=A0AB33KRP6_9FLAO|nr:MULTISPECIES: hypothetical protein [unclassified Tenacibaculum]MCG7502120.1 hypothetical protein [Tenacibaculum sp. Mcav3-52]MCO7185850.1 hypothetical protein [Tenacibaculum sp. XPcli2-G]BFF40828.1 hypothetical protein BACY1_26330 [Tenacibaculum mesophilum]GFD83135.1 hypothetical protein KUL118_59970 [Tenacibaculum sp. KUL118]
MIKTEKNSKGVIGITQQASLIDKNIGSYKEHFINEHFGYTVKLSNGVICIPRKIAEDYEVQKGIVTNERIKEIAKTYTYQEI